MPRHAYAEYQPYGLRTVSSDDCAIRFASAAERDAFVEDENHRAHDRNHRRVAQAVTRDEARRVYRVETITDACTLGNLASLDNDLGGCSPDDILDHGYRTAVAYRRHEVAQCWCCSDLRR